MVYGVIANSSNILRYLLPVPVLEVVEGANARFFSMRTNNNLRMISVLLIGLAQAASQASNGPATSIVCPDYRAATIVDGLWVAVGPGAAIRTSADGLNWDYRDSKIQSSLYAIAYGSACFVAVGDES